MKYVYVDRASVKRPVSCPEFPVYGDDGRYFHTLIQVPDDLPEGTPLHIAFDGLMTWDACFDGALRGTGNSIEQAVNNAWLRKPFVNKRPLWKRAVGSLARLWYNAR